MVELQAPTGFTASLFCHDAEVPHVTQGTKSLAAKSQRFYRKNIVILLNLASCAALADDFKVALFDSFAVISDFKTQEPWREKLDFNLSTASVKTVFDEFFDSWLQVNNDLTWADL